MLFFGMKKEGYHIDEMYTYGLSNSYSYGMLEWDPNFANRWQLPHVFSDYLTVQEGERFAYKTVYRNQEMDVHPPFYYYLMHTISSMHPEIFTKWQGIGLNMLFFAFSSIFIFLLSDEIFKNKAYSLIACALWGASSGAINSVVFIRMYVMLTTFILLFTYLIFKNLYTPRISRKIFMLFSLIVFTGFMTHYYFLVYLFFLSLCIGMFFLCNKSFSNLFGYCLSVLSGIILGLLHFPRAIQHIFFGYRGVENQDNFTSTDNLIEDLIGYLGVLDRALFGEIFKIIFIIAAIILLIRIISNFVYVSYDKKFKSSIAAFVAEITFNLKKPSEVKILITSEYIKFFILLITTSLYLILISNIVSYTIDRYIVCIYPNVVIVFVFALHRLLSIKNISLNLHRNIVICTCTIVLISGFMANNINRLYFGGADVLQQVKENKDLYAIAISSRDFDVSNNILEFVNYRAFASIGVDGASDRINELTSGKEESNSIIIYIANGEDQNAVIEKIVQNTSYRNRYERLYRFGRFTAYKFSKNIPVRLPFISNEYKFSDIFTTRNGTFEENSFISNGQTSHFVVFGPYWDIPKDIPNGVYNITFDYEVIEYTDHLIGHFDIAHNYGRSVIAENLIDLDSDSHTFYNIELSDILSIEFRVFVHNGTRLKINSVSVELLEEL